MKTYKVVNEETMVQPFYNEYRTENEIEALKLFIIESEDLVKDFKNINFTFELDTKRCLVKEYLDGEEDGEVFIAIEVM